MLDTMDPDGHRNEIYLKPKTFHTHSWLIQNDPGVSPRSGLHDTRHHGLSLSAAGPRDALRKTYALPCPLKKINCSLRVIPFQTHYSDVASDRPTGCSYATYTF